MVFHGFANAREDDPLLGQLFLECGFHRHRVHDGVDCRSTKRQTFLQGNAQLIESFLEFRVDLLVLGFLSQRIGIIRDILIIDRGNMNMSPFGFGEGCPKAISLQTKLKKPVGLTLFLRDESDDILVQSFRNDIGLHVRGKAKLILLIGYLFDKLIISFCLHMMMNGLPKIFQGESDAPQASRRYAIAAPQRCCSTPIAFRQTLAHSSAMERLGEALCY